MPQIICRDPPIKLLMKHIILLPVAISLFLIACNSVKQPLLNQTNLAGNSIKLKSNLAYNFKTPKGAVIKIAANSFDAPENELIDFEIKEAYSMQDILKTGLVTESNGQLLRSGGMIYLNATVNNKKIDLLKPLNVSIPSDVFDDKMKVFKGEIKQDSTINWVDPRSLDSGRVARQMAIGGQLFKANCADCHKPSNDFTGPALGGCRQRGTDADWAFRFTNNTNSMLERDTYARSLWAKYGSRMTQFNLKYKELEAIFDYCDNEADLNPRAEPNTMPIEMPPVNRDTTKGLGTFINPCGLDTVYIPTPSDEIEVLPLVDTVPIILNSEDLTPRLSDASSTEGYRKGFNEPNPTKGMYDFTIKTLGWYNIDAYVAGYDESTYVEVNVELQMQDDADMNVYLFYPSKKMLSVGTAIGKHSFNFDKVDGKIPLFLNDSVIVLAFGSKGDKTYYGATTFIAKEKQTINLPIKPVGAEELQKFIEKNKINGITIDVNKKENFYVVPNPCFDNNNPQNYNAPKL